MRKILLFSVLLLVLGCSSNSSNDFIGEYTLYSSMGKPMYDGKPFIKVFQDKDSLYLINFRDKDTIPMKILNSEEIEKQRHPVSMSFEYFKIDIINGIERIRREGKSNKYYAIYKVNREYIKDFIPVNTDIFINYYESTAFLKKIK